MSGNVTLRAICLVFVSCLVLVGCGESESTNSPIRIIGINPVDSESSISTTTFQSDDWFVDSPFEFTFSVIGGTGSYDVRYLPTAPEGSVFELEPEDNINNIEMSIVRDEEFVNRFTLVGTPTFPDGVDALDVGDDLSYFIQIDDGTTEALFRFEVRLDENSVQFSTTQLSANEALSGNVQQAEQLFDRALQIEANGLSQQVVCETIREEPIDASTILDGRQLNFFYTQVRLSGPPSTRTVLRYRPTSSYNESEPEFSRTNLGQARPGLDFEDVERTIVFQPGEINCAVKVGVFADVILEGTEVFSVEVTGSEGSILRVDQGRTGAVIVDNEPPATYVPEERVVNRGGDTQYAFSSNVLIGQQTNILFGVDSSESTATSEQFTLFPQSQVIELTDTNPIASMSVSANLYALDPTPGLDPRVTLITQIDELFGLNDQATVVFNEWATSGNLDDEIVGRASAGEEVVDFTVDEQGNIYTLKQGQSLTGQSTATVTATTRNGSVINLSNTSADLVFERNGINVVPVGIAASFDTARNFIVVAFEVDGLFVNQTFGGRDFVLAVYEITESGYVQIGIEQFGSELDDDLEGLRFNQNLELLVFGETDGTTLSGSPGVVISSGQRDGFAYLIDVNGPNLVPQWSRFVGTTGVDRISQVDIGRTEMVMLVETIGTGTDVRISTINVSDGTDSDSVNDVRLTSALTSSFAGIDFADSQSRYFLSGSSAALLDDQGITPSGTEDAFIFQYDSQGALINSIRLASLSTDQVGSAAILPDRDRFAVVGQTAGVFDGELSLGQTDAYFASIDLADVFEVSGLTQFGTPGNDTVLDIERVSTDKYLVLWSEDFSSGDNSLVYRISAFTPQGEKLSPNPQ